MKYQILKITLAAVFLLGMPATINAESSVEMIDVDYEEVTISISESVLHVTGASGLFMQIYNVAGVRVMNVKVDGADKRYDLNLPKGCYIVKVGKTVRKIAIR